MEPLRELRTLILRHANATPLATSDLLGLKFNVARYTPEPVHHVYEPVFSLVVQGEKRAVLGDKLFTCRMGHILVTSVGLPLTIHISVARPEQPFVALGMMLRPAKIAELLLESAVADRLPAEAAALGVSDDRPNSSSSFHRHFRAVALMSPLQYLKQIRLQEARARLLAGADDVMTVGLAVGYDSPSQFSREYKRAYGSPPGQDARLLRASNGRPAPPLPPTRTRARVMTRKHAGAFQVSK